LATRSPAVAGAAELAGLLVVELELGGWPPGMLVVELELGGWSSGRRRSPPRPVRLTQI
jgi:hypothetical protein